jgi:ABC-type transport system involved in multi-copper enzyme maturation permease subunit
MTTSPSILAEADFFYRYGSLLVAGAIVVLGLFVFGLKDVLRFSLARVWAVSNVNFTEALRKRVLWVAPLAMIGVIAVSQFQRPIDELDAIRQTTKFCLFATGLLVVVLAIILACTNLPKEVENKVIFTIVTKPTTRLEIILGKIVGFARVSALILIVMGIFTFGYLHVRAWTMQRDLKQRLDEGRVDPAQRGSLEYYAANGLLNAKEYFTPIDLNFYSRIPQDENGVKWISSTAEQSVAVPFEIPLTDLPANSEEASQLPPLRVIAQISLHKVADEQTPAEETPITPATRPASRPAPPAPAVVVELLDKDFFTWADSSEVERPKPIVATSGENQQIQIDLPAAALPDLRKHTTVGSVARFHVSIRCGTPGYELGIAPGAVRLGYASPTVGAFANGLEYPVAGGEKNIVYRGRTSTHGLQLRGVESSVTPIAVYRFREQHVAQSGMVPVELKTYIEGSGEDENQLTALQVQVYNRQTHTLSDAAVMHPENGRTAYASVPAAAMAGGDFDLIFRVDTGGAWLSFDMTNLGLVKADRSFALNLTKSLFILWLMSVLVITISVFCSTFLSWPIAVVLTIVVLMGRWAVLQMGDALTPGIGRQIVQDLSLRGSAESEVVSRSVEALSRALQTVTSVLPDISQFSVTEDIERGIWIPLSTIGHAGIVLLLFGIPLTVLAYVIFRNKEVAP